MTTPAHTNRQTQPTLAVTLGHDASPLLETADLLSSSSPLEEPSRRPRQQHAHKAAPLGPTHGYPRQPEAEEVRSSRHSRAQSVLTESEAELSLTESRVSSVIAEEEVAGTHMAESVAESVSDFQYSMDFESSIHRSPLSGFRSPAAGGPTLGCYLNPDSFVMHELCAVCLSVCLPACLHNLVCRAKFCFVWSRWQSMSSASVASNEASWGGS